jgi:hypothetical protein
MAYTTINKSTEHFDTKVYTGNGTSQTLDMDNLGLLWMKNRTETSNHNLFDVVRGGYNTPDPGPNLRTNGTTAGHGSDITSAYGITFDSSSSTIGSDGGGYNYNQSGKSYVGWQWRANGAGVSNTDGSTTSTVSANQTSGFSVVKWVGVDTTVGHGLNAVPEMIIVKNTDDATNWFVYHKTLGNNKYLNLNLTSAETTSSSQWNSTSPTSSVFTVGSGFNNANYIAYVFAPKKGFSKFGSYVGNNNGDGTFVYTGFKPAFVLFKPSSATENWQIHDNKRPSYNPCDNIAPNNSSAEADNDFVDLVSNGFKLRSATYSASGVTYIYMAFAEEPLVGTNNIPATAR